LIQEYEAGIEKAGKQNNKEKDLKVENEINELDQVIKKWRIGCQQGITQLQHLLSESEPTSVCKIVEKLGIDPKLLNFNNESEEFEE